MLRLEDGRSWSKSYILKGPHLVVEYDTRFVWRRLDVHAKQVGCHQASFQIVLKLPLVQDQQRKRLDISHEASDELPHIFKQHPQADAKQELETHF